MSKAIKNSLSAVGLLFLGLVFALPVCASNKASSEISADEKKKVFEKISTLQKDVHSLRASVSQEKHLTLLKKQINVEGTVTIAKPDRLRWDMVRPERAITVVDGENMTVYHPDKKEAQVRALSDSPIASNAMSFFVAFMSGSLGEIEKKFMLQIFRQDGRLIFKLTPLSGMAGKYLSSVTIQYEEATGLPQEFEMTTPKGDRTVTRLTNIRTNPALKPETFKLKLPDDVWITNKFEPINNN